MSSYEKAMLRVLCVALFVAAVTVSIVAVSIGHRLAYGHLYVHVLPAARHTAGCLAGFARNGRQP